MIEFPKVKVFLELSKRFIAIFRLASKCDTSLFRNKPVSTSLSLITVVSLRILLDLFSSVGNSSGDSFDNVPYDSNFQKFECFGQWYE